MSKNEMKSQLPLLARPKYNGLDPAWPDSGYVKGPWAVTSMSRI